MIIIAALLSDASIILKKFKIFAKIFDFRRVFLLSACLTRSYIVSCSLLRSGLRRAGIVSFDRALDRCWGLSGGVSMCKSGGKGFFLEAGGRIWYKQVNETGYFWFLVGGM